MAKEQICARLAMAAGQENTGIVTG